MSTSIGTSGVIFAHRDAFTPDPSGRVHAFCHAVPGAFHLMAVTLSAGGSLSWWRERLGGGASFDDLIEEAESVEPGSEGLLFLPYLTGERSPHLDPHARGGFVGLTVRHGRAHMTRAVMEGVAFSMRDGLEVMRGLGTPDEDMRAVGGGARSPLWLRLQADVYGRTIRRTEVDEGPAYGAALLGGVAAGVFADVDEASRRVRLRERGHRARRRAREALRRAVRDLRVAVRRAARADARARSPGRRLTARRAAATTGPRATTRRPQRPASFTPVSRVPPRGLLRLPRDARARRSRGPAARAARRRRRRGAAAGGDRARQRAGGGRRRADRAAAARGTRRDRRGAALGAPPRRHRLVRGRRRRPDPRRRDPPPLLLGQRGQGDAGAGAASARRATAR